jgi:hypothetical protein
MWKQIIDFPNYEVSEDGIVRNNKTNQILKNLLHPTTERYVVNLYKNGKAKQYHVHRLVAIAFIPNDEGKIEVDHIDRNKLNNNVSNLRWASRSENVINRDYFCVKGNEDSHHIHETSSGTYHVQFKSLFKKAYNKTFKTKEEAIVCRDTFIKNNPR